MRSSAARAFAFLFFLSGATGLVYELLWVRLLYQAFGSTIQSVTTVVAAYMGGLGLMVCSRSPSGRSASFRRSSSRSCTGGTSRPRLRGI
ncbi:MAG: hypothetical protein AUI33_06530 [Ignavibacteria bacterium 13_1_40CM_2_61_4]|nr:MAG: hypothetical protein AUI33_06530 [Ignavibacteria bacterium 13_1_40CM_2_61_4]